MTLTEVVMSSLEVSLENTVIFRVEVFLHSKDRSWLMTFWPDLSDPRVLESQSRVDFQNKTRPSPSLTNKVIFFPRNQQFTLSRLQKSILNFASHFKLNPDRQKCVEDFIKKCFPGSFRMWPVQNRRSPPNASQGSGYPAVHRKNVRARWMTPNRAF